MRALLLVVVTAWFSVAVSAAELSDRIREVETGLRPRRVLAGRPVPRYTIEERMHEYNVKGLAISVINNYQIEWSKAYGFADVESKRPVSLETLFQAGSISKPVAAVAAMQLVERRKLDLDSDVNTWLKSWKTPDNEFTRDQKVTLRRIMSHSAGLTVHGFPGYEAGKPLPTVPEILDGKPPANTAAVRVDTVPGTKWRYSGGGYTILQLLMTDVTRRPFPALLDGLVLKRACMEHSTYDQPLPAAKAALAATGYKADGTSIPGRAHVYPEMAAAGLWTTAVDLARFAVEIQKSHEGRSNRILSKGTVHEMLREQMKPYGLGFALEEKEGVRKFGHGGVDEGFQAQLMATLDGRGYAIMTNSDNGMRLIGELALAVAAAYGWPDKPEQRAAASLTSEQMVRFAGTYRMPPLGLITVGVEGDHFRLKSPRLGDTSMYPQSETKLFPLEDGLPNLTFMMPEGGGPATGFTGGGGKAVRVK